MIGGGPAGCLAAIAARRNGADTLLIEKEGHLSGNMTGALITSLHGYRLHKNYSSKITTSSWDSPRSMERTELRKFGDSSSA